MGWGPSPLQTKPATEDPQSPGGSYKPLKRNERKACWEARDGYFACLDRNDILDAVKESTTAAQQCGKESDLFEKDCATSWVVYFKQKRVADFNKLQQMKKLEAEGAVPMSSAVEQPKWKFW